MFSEEVQQKMKKVLEEECGKNATPEEIEIMTNTLAKYYWILLKMKRAKKHAKQDKLHKTP